MPKKELDSRPLRTTIYDYLEQANHNADSNKYCERANLSNESSVETFFANRLLEDLGYADKEIKTKESIDELTISLGKRKEPYKPDYVLSCNGKPRWLLDAKETVEDVDKWVTKCVEYAHFLNRKYTGENPVQYYGITNGIVLKLFKWDEMEPELTLHFSDFTDDNQKFRSLKFKIGADIARKGFKEVQKRSQDVMRLTKPTKENVIKLFNSCHRVIWKAEKHAPIPAFFGFVKIVFVKLWKDRELHEDPDISEALNDGEPIPKEKVMFSTHWIDSQPVDNPIDTILFQPLIRKIEESVSRHDKKRMFDADENISLHPGTIRLVVSKLESSDLYGVDEDLNGRLFETFLSATMRGAKLGQYFTPRTIVKLMIELAQPKVDREHIDTVLDGCCGTGGFLIEALTQMRNQVRANTSLSDDERLGLLNKIANESLVGVDAGSDPPIARIARINMYLHGDGGSQIYHADALDKVLYIPEYEEKELKLELEELQKLLKNKQFNVVLTNPPFSMDYSYLLPDEERILHMYNLARWKFNKDKKKWEFHKDNKARPTLRSSVMFLERYADLLEPGGRLLTVIDDSILSGKNNDFVRAFIRERFIVRGIISLSGDAFQRVGARVKTSILYLVRRSKGDTSQPDVFMYESEFVGLDDVPPKTPPSVAAEAKQKAEEEVYKIAEEFKRYLRGEKGTWLVPSSQILDRLDVKFCLPREGDIVEEWRSTGYEVIPLMKVVDPITIDNNPEGVVSPKKDPEKTYTFLKVTYAGIPLRGESRLGKELSYSKVMRVQSGDIAISNIAAALGATGIITDDLTDVLVSSEFTILRMKDDRFDPMFLWGFLRSAEVRARLLSKSSGLSRHRVGWEELKEVPVPMLPDLQNKIAQQYREFLEAEIRANKAEVTGNHLLNDALGTDNEWAKKRLKVAKPPR